MTKNSKEALKKRADARFRQEERALDGRKAMTEYEAQVLAIREKTVRLRALRLDKEAAEKNEGVAADSGQPLVARKKRTMAASRKNTRMHPRLEKTARLKALRLAKEGAEKKNSAA